MLSGGLPHAERRVASFSGFRRGADCDLKANRLDFRTFIVILNPHSYCKDSELDHLSALWHFVR
jgi:hypothetical protein